MKTIKQTIYQCEICGQQYKEIEDAEECEATPITQNYDVKVGDKVRIIHGDGRDKLLAVKRIVILNKDYGHHQFKRYWHTIALSGDILDENETGSGFSRFLTWDEYITI